jgi:hypothetical protein
MKKCALQYQQGLVGTLPLRKCSKPTGQQEFDPLKSCKSANTWSGDLAGAIAVQLGANRLWTIRERFVHLRLVQRVARFSALRIKPLK